VLSWRPKPFREFIQFIWWMQTERPVGANPQTKPVDLGCEYAGLGCCHPHPLSPFVIITQLESWYWFYRPMEDGRLGWRRHCSKGAQPVPKAVYRSGRRNKHNRPRWGSNLGPVTTQLDALTTGPPWPWPAVYMWMVSTHRRSTVLCSEFWLRARNGLWLFLTCV